MFKDAGVEPRFAQVVDDRGRSAGFGYAAFHSEADQKTALSRLNRKVVNGREIRIVDADVRSYKVKRRH